MDFFSNRSRYRKVTLHLHASAGILFIPCSNPKYPNLYTDGFFSNTRQKLKLAIIEIIFYLGVPAKHSFCEYPMLEYDIALNSCTMHGAILSSFVSHSYSTVSYWYFSHYSLIGVLDIAESKFTNELTN